MTRSPLDHPVAEIAARVARGEWKARDLVERSLARIAALDPRVHAFLHVGAEAARALADGLDRRVAAGEPVGPLAGVPLAVKDNVAVAGQPLTCASRILGGYVPARDATVVARAVAAGAVVVGKTNLDEFAMGSSTENSAFGATRNPHDLTRVPGGSSGGSAAAVAAGMVPLALGSETGGSIRQPASLCGIVGHKPTYGRVSRSGLVAFASSLDQVGPLARTVEDAARLQAVIEGTDADDATTRAMAPCGDGAPASLAGLRVGLVDELDVSGETADPDVRDAVRRARAAIERAGATPVRVSIPSTRFGIPVYYLVATAEASSNLARFDGIRYGLRVEDTDLESLYAKSRDAGFGPEVKRRILLGTFALSAGYADAYYKRALAVQARLRAEFAAAFSTCDVLLSATSPFPAFAAGDKVDDPLAMYLCDVLTVGANLAGIPAISVPGGRTRTGLPIGLQVWAADGCDARCFSVGSAVSRAVGASYERPALCAEAP